MNITELNSNKTHYEAQIIVPNDTIEQEISAELKKIAKTAKMDGFRVGKVPAHIISKKYGPSVRFEVVKHQLNISIEKVVKEKDLNVAFDPEVLDVKNEEKKDLEFKLKFELMPEITIPDFKKITIEKPVLETKATEVTEYINKVAENAKDYNESKDKAANGDQVTIDATGYVGGEKFDGGELKAH